MFWALNDTLGKVLLVAVIGVAAVCILRPFWEFGTTWYQCQEDVAEYQRQCEERPPVGFLYGKTYYSREEFEADWEERRREQAEKWERWGQPHEHSFQDIRGVCPDPRLGQ